jgi:four helix bundle protein
MPHRDWRVLDAAEQAAVRIVTLIDESPPRRLLFVAQLRDAGESIPANIAEGIGRGEGDDFTYKLRVARGEAEETIRHLKTNFKTGRIVAGSYWPLRNLLKTIVKMLDGIIGDR